MNRLTRPWRPSTCGAGALLLLIAGCGSTHPIDVATRPQLAPDRMVEFDFGGRRIQLDSVVIGRDSISGIPWHEPTLCCTRVAYPLARVSKPALRTFPSLGSIALGIAGVFAAFIAFIAYELRNYD